MTTDTRREPRQPEHIGSVLGSMLGSIAERLGAGGREDVARAIECAIPEISGIRVQGAAATSAAVAPERADRTVRAYPSEAVLTIEQVAEWLQMSVRSVERLDLPCVYLGTRTRRFLAKHIVEYLERRVA